MAEVDEDSVVDVEVDEGVVGEVLADPKGHQIMSKVSGGRGMAPWNSS